MARREYSCGLEAALAIIGGKWKSLILWNLAKKPCRFGELRRLVIGVSEKVLIQELKEMVSDRIVIRRDYSEVPPRVEYSLTEFGRSLAETLEPLCDWGSQHMRRIAALPTQRPASDRRIESPKAGVRTRAGGSV